MVISVDTGNKMIKTEHYEFNSGIDVLDTIPGENDEVIEFGGKYYRTTNRRMLQGISLHMIQSEKA